MSMMRYGLSIAIVSMVTRPASDHHHQFSTTTNTTATHFLTSLTTISSTGLDDGDDDGGVCSATGVDDVDGGVNGTVDSVYTDSVS